MVASWLSLGAYTTWFLARAKQYNALSPGDVYVLWSLHKQEAHCNALSYICKLHKKKGIVGFKCFCGYEHKSRRPIV